MPDARQHRGKHPSDVELFAADQLPVLRTAVHDLSWLLTHGYSDSSALKLVGDRYALRARQRDAVMRCACSDRSFAQREATQVTPSTCRGSHLAVDGYNVLITVESALSGGVLLIGRDGCCRDIAGLHGTYKAVEETRPALTFIGGVLHELTPEHIVWYLDAPISNSGRLAALMRDLSANEGWNWQVELVLNADPVLASGQGIVASSDSWILDRAGAWFNLAWHVISRRGIRTDFADLREPGPHSTLSI